VTVFICPVSFAQIYSGFGTFTEPASIETDTTEWEEQHKHETDPTHEYNS